MPQATHLWRPSSARTLTLDAFVPAPRGGAAIAPALQAWAMKDPVDVLDYVVDLSPATVGNEGDSITTIDVSITPNGVGDLALVSAAADDPRVVLWLGSGRAGVTYTVTLRAGFSSGRQVARDLLLPVVQLATPTDGNVLTAQPGSAMTTPTGTLTVG